MFLSGSVCVTYSLVVDAGVAGYSCMGGVAEVCRGGHKTTAQNHRAKTRTAGINDMTVQYIVISSIYVH